MTGKWKKLRGVEERLGCTFEEYVEKCSREGKSQRQMAEECEVTSVTMCRWMERAGYVKASTFKRRPKVA
jgi:transposase